jgi:DNA-binding MarR family transcriptional regulator
LRVISQKKLHVLRETRKYGTGRLLLLARRDFVARVGRRMQTRGLASMPESWRAMLPFIDLDGTRSTLLALRAGVSKQAVGKIVRELEEHGLLTRSPDPTDGRSFLVQFTELGLERLLQTHVIIDEIEREYERLVGARAMQTFRRCLRVIAYDADADSGSVSESPRGERKSSSRRKAAVEDTLE